MAKEFKRNALNQRRPKQTFLEHQETRQTGKQQAVKLVNSRQNNLRVYENQRKAQVKQIIQTQPFQYRNKANVLDHLDQLSKETADFFYRKKEIENKEPRPYIWFERKHYNRLVTVLQPKIIKVPVQKVLVSQYSIQHRIDYIKKEVIQIKPELQKRELVSYRLQYVPVQKVIVHIPQKCVKVQQEASKVTQQVVKTTQNRSCFNMNFGHGTEIEANEANRIQIPYFVTSKSYDYDLSTKKWELLTQEMQLLKEKERELAKPGHIIRFNR